MSVLPQITYSNMALIFLSHFHGYNKNVIICIYAVHDYFKHAGGRDIFLLDWRQVLSYDVSFLNIRIVVNSVINLVNKNLPRTALQICIVDSNCKKPLVICNSVFSIFLNQIKAQKGQKIIVWIEYFPYKYSFKVISND
jgi:hypothetical protein